MVIGTATNEIKFTLLSFFVHWEIMRCSKCWCPDSIIAESGHNIGCPDHVDALPTAQADYDRGYRDGFNALGEELSMSQIARIKNKSYAFGIRSGQAAIDALADEAAQSNYA